MPNKIILLSIVFLSFLSNTVLAQEDIFKAIKLYGGYSKSSSGESNGTIISIEYEQKLKRNWFWASGFSASINNGSGTPVSFNYNNRVIDATIKETTAGIQATGGIGLFVLKTTANQAGLKFGGLARYQSTSATANITTLFPPATNLPYPVYVMDNVTPQKTYSVGLYSQIFWNIRMSSKLGAGVVGGIQLDTNGDNIMQLSISFTRFLK